MVVKEVPLNFWNILNHYVLWSRMSSRFLQTALILNSCAGMPLTQNQRKLLIQISYHRYKEFVYIWFNFCPYMIELAYISLRMTIAWNKWLCLCCCYCFGKDSFQTSSLKSPVMKKKVIYVSRESSISSGN